MMRKGFGKLVVALRYFLLGKEYSRAIRALEYAMTIHKGTRKDKITPEFQHQVEIALYLITIHGVENLEDVIIAALLHDTEEDYNVPRKEIQDMFGAVAEEAVWVLTKVYNGAKKTPEEYFDNIARNQIASLVKGADRINNLTGMVDVFTLNGQRHYVKETKEHFFPMLKSARKNFPQQMLAYHNINTMLIHQIELIEHILLMKEK